MTNALAQNIDNDKNSAIDSIMQAVNISSSQKTQEDNSGEFSNLMNNLDARMQKAQNNFSQKAKITNTSSINKKALEKKEVVTQNSSNIQKNLKNNSKDATNNSNEITETKNIAKDITNGSIKNINNNADDKANVNEKYTNEQPNKSGDNSLDLDYSDNLSDINNSSPVETSPVFPLNEEEIQVSDDENEFDIVLDKIENDIKDVINTILIVNEDTHNQIDDFKNKIDDLINSFENIDNDFQSVEKIETNLDNANFKQNQNEEILNTLNEIKNLVENIFEQTDENIDFSQKLSQIKDTVQNLLDNIDIKQNSNEANLNSKFELLDNNFAELKNQWQEIDFANNNLDKIKDDISKFQDLKTEIKDALKSNDIEKLDNLKESLSKVLDNLNIDTNEELNEVSKDFNLVENLNNGLDKINNLISKALNNQNKIEQNDNLKQEIIEVDFSKNINTNENNNFKLYENLDKLTSDDFKNIDISDKNQTKEILSLLQNVQNEISSKDENEDIKNQINTLIENINNNSISLADVTQNIDNLSNEIKTQFDKPEQNDVLISDNTIDVSDVFSKSENNNQNLSDNKNNFNENQLLNRNEKNILNDINDLDKNADFDVDLENVKVKSVSSSKIDVKNVEENLQKSIYTQEIMDEMMVEVNIKTIPSQSGALSVSDEIAKMAIGESNALNATNSIHGSITYDSVGSNTIIKNPISLMKMAQTQNANSASMEDILNQIGSKINQMQNNSAQKLTMVLRPNDLGRLSIELTQNQNGLMTQILAQNDDVRAYIERNIDSLRQQLSDAGVNVNSIQIKTAGQEGSTQYDGNQNLNNQQENLEQQNNKQNQNQEQKNGNKETKEALASMSNYEMSFKKDFSSVLNNTLNYSLN